MGGQNSMYGVVIDPDGRIVVTAAAGQQGNTMVVARYWP